MSASRDHIVAYSKSQQPSKAPFAAYERSTVVNLDLKTVKLMPSPVRSVPWNSDHLARKTSLTFIQCYTNYITMQKSHVPDVSTTTVAGMYVARTANSKSTSIELRQSIHCSMV